MIRTMERFVSRAWRAISRRMAAWGARSPGRARLYYAFFNKGYGHDQRSFLAGRLAYGEALRVPVATMSMLRRNIHRLEKGMLMRPQRTPFGESYISETVDAYRIALANGVDPAELAWAHDVLAEYFLIHRDHPRLDPARDAFVDAPPPAENTGKRVPYRRAHPSSSPIELDALAHLALHRRSVRWYLPAPVPREAVDRAVEIAIQAPSACNRQPYEFRIFDDARLVEQVLSIPYGTAGFRHNVPMVIVVVGKQRHFIHERDRHLIYIDASLATMGLLYGLEVQGISSCCINWPDLGEKHVAMARLLSLAPDERAVMLLTLGYPDPDGLVANSTKKSLPIARRYNFE